MIKNVIFDVDGVLRNLIDAPILDILDEPLKQKYFDRYNGISVKQLYRKYLKHEYKPYLEFDKGYLTDNEIVKQICNDYGEPYEALSKIFDYHNYPEKQEFFNPTILLAKKLKKQGYKIFILSNMNLNVANLLKNYFKPNLFDDMLFSCDVHMMKPNADFYEYALAKWNIETKESIFIDDREANLKPFSLLGGYTFLFNNKDVKNSVIELKKYIFNN